MNALLGQIMLIAQGQDVHRWTNVLFVVVLAVFWVVGSIIKAKTKKPEGEGEKEGQLSRKVGGKLKEAAERFQRELSQLGSDRAQEPREQAQGLQKQSFPQAARPARQPAARKAFRPTTEAVRAQPLARRVPIRKRPTSKATEEVRKDQESSPLMPAVHTGIEDLPEFIDQPVEGLTDKYAHISAERPATKSALEPLLDLDYADTDELRRAILYGEILGKPLGL